MERRALRIPLVSENEIPMEARRSFQEVIGPYSKEQALSEADRCLACHTMCSLCVTVCPNRANQMYVMEPFRAEVPSLVVKEGELVVDGIQSFGVEQIYQIINIADFCNECGNCTTFCPTSGAPFRDKPRIHLTQEGYEKAWYDAWRIVEEEGGVQVLARIDSVEHSLWISEKEVRYEGQGVSVLFDEDTFGMVEAEAMKELLEGSRIDLRVAAQMMVVAKSRSVMVH
jgi:putative selenate reductase